MKTEVIKRTLSPTWDQTLIFDCIEIHGNPPEIIQSPPLVIVEVFDHDVNVILMHLLTIMEIGIYFDFLFKAI